MGQYKKEYIDGKKIPAPLAVCAALSQLTGVIFFYTGIAILRLRRNARRLISAGFLAGFLWYCTFLWSAFVSAAFPLHIAKRAGAILALTEGKTIATAYTTLDMASIPAVKITIIAVLTGYLAFMAITSLFFSRKTIQKKFL
jgi:hypothetical protein